jgi:hypothetical protein
MTPTAQADSAGFMIGREIRLVQKRTCNWSIQDRREVAPLWVAVLADCHQCHWPDRAETLRQTPAKQRCASDRHEKRDWLPRHSGRPQQKRLYIIFSL